MNAMKNTLRKTLGKLTSQQFKNFKYHLKDMGEISGYDLENSDPYDIVEKMVEVYTIKTCDKVILMILNDMNLNQMALDLKNDLSKFEFRV